MTKFRKVVALVTVPSLVAVLSVALWAAEKEPSDPAKKAEAPFQIKRYKFTWTVAEHEKAKLQIVKTHETITVQISDGDDWLYLTPAEAEQLAAPMSRAKNMQQKLKGTEDADETVDTKSHNVNYRYSAKYGFTVYVRSKEGYTFGSFGISADDAVMLSKHLAKAKAMAAFVDKRIRP